MVQATITGKGQVTIPAAVRKALALGPGDRVAFTVQEDGNVVLRKAYQLSDLFDCLGPPPARPADGDLVTPFRKLRFD